MHGFAVYVKEELPFAQDLSLANSVRILTSVFDWFASFSVLLLFSQSTSFLSLCTVFNAISSYIYEVLLINPSANAFVIGDFNAHHKD